MVIQEGERNRNDLREKSGFFVFKDKIMAQPWITANWQRKIEKRINFDTIGFNMRWSVWDTALYYAFRIGERQPAGNVPPKLHELDIFVDESSHNFAVIIHVRPANISYSIDNQHTRWIISRKREKKTAKEIENIYFYILLVFSEIPATIVYQKTFFDNCQQCNRHKIVWHKEEGIYCEMCYQDIKWQEKETLKRDTKKAERTKKDGFVYLIKWKEYYKIGRSNNPDTRLKTLGTQPPFDFEKICVVKSADMVGLESSLHAKFTKKRKRGEWFTLDAQDVEYIKGLAQ